VTTMDALTGRALPGPARGLVARVLICDERSMTRLALTNALKASFAATDIRCVSDGFELSDAFAARPANLVLIGFRAGRPSGVQATDLLLSLHPSAAVIVFGSADTSRTLAAAVSRGARGVMMWNPTDAGPLGGRGRFGQSGSRAPNATQQPKVQLTERELEVLRGMSQGQSNGEIGRSLFLSEDTIKTHARRMFNKLGARDRAHAVALGMRHSLVE
jgi:DNA-binding NarL/FixJ family response regulator